jgi:DNA topoisomerase IA
MVVKSSMQLVSISAATTTHVNALVGLIVLQRNYLEVYPYDKWSAKEIPNFQEGEQFVPTVCEIKDGQTSSPSLLTEADLVTLMDKNGIGVFLHTMSFAPI